MKSGLVGFKPTTVLVPRDAVVPISDRQDSVGPMARTVRDAAYVLTAIASNFNTSTHPTTKMIDYVKFTQTTDLKGLRVGVPREDINRAISLDKHRSKRKDGEKGYLEEYVLTTFEKALQKLSEMEATVVDNVQFRSQDEWNSLSSPMRGIPGSGPLEAEFKASLARWCSMLTANPHDIRSLDDLIDFTCRTHAVQEEYPKRDVGRLVNSQRSPGINAPIVQESLHALLRIAGDEGILSALHDYQVDVLVFPNISNISASSMAATAGFPVFALPLGHYPEGAPTYTSGVEGELVDIDKGIPYVFCIQHR